MLVHIRRRDVLQLFLDFRFAFWLQVCLVIISNRDCFAYL